MLIKHYKPKNENYVCKAFVSLVFVILAILECFPGCILNSVAQLPWVDVKATYVYEL